MFFSKPKENSSELPSLKELLTIAKQSLYYQSALLANKTLISQADPDKTLIKSLVLNPPNLQLSRAISSFICAAIGDSLGCHTEFSKFFYEKPQFNIQNFSNFKQNNDLRAQIGQWTDDTSMALCLADSIIEQEGVFNGIDIRYRFLLWWHMGYNNGTKTHTSFGLGGNISESFENFYTNPDSAYMVKTDKNKNNNGNGSLMRLAPVPLFFHDNEEKGMEYARNQSFTTHTGEEAAECCRLLTHLIIQLIKRKKEDFKEIFNNLNKTFKTECLSVMKLAASEREINVKPDKFNWGDDDRDWNWKNEKFRYSPLRSNMNPEYFGSYCMDALALSLHYAFHSKNAKEAVCRAVNAGGDADTVAAITGQIVGAIYGLETEVLELYKEGVVKWDDWAIATCAYKLFEHKAKFKKKNFFENFFF